MCVYMCIYMYVNAASKNKKTKSLYKKLGGLNNSMLYVSNDVAKGLSATFAACPRLAHVAQHARHQHEAGNVATNVANNSWRVAEPLANSCCDLGPTHQLLCSRSLPLQTPHAKARPLPRPPHQKQRAMLPKLGCLTPILPSRLQHR